MSEEEKLTPGEEREFVKSGITAEGLFEDYVETKDLETLLRRLCLFADWINTSNDILLYQAKEELDKKILRKLREHRHLENGEVVTPI